MSSVHWRTAQRTAGGWVVALSSDSVGRKTGDRLEEAKGVGAAAREGGCASTLLLNTANATRALAVEVPRNLAADTLPEEIENAISGYHGGFGIASPLVLEFIVVKATVANHQTVWNTHQLVVGEACAGAQITIIK